MKSTDSSSFWREFDELVERGLIELVDDGKDVQVRITLKGLRVLAQSRKTQG
jgi:predicted transcriptional regulator